MDGKDFEPYSSQRLLALLFFCLMALCCGCTTLLTSELVQNSRQAMCPFCRDAWSSVICDYRQASAQQRKDKEAASDRRVPITILCGFLGAGKSTMLSHILHNKKDRKIAVIVNDMAAVNVDAELIKNVKRGVDGEEGGREVGQLVELENGCICCTFSEELVQQILQLATPSSNASADANSAGHLPFRSHLDAVVIECSGVAEPAPLVELFAKAEKNDKEFSRKCRLDTMVTVVDGARFLADCQSGDSVQGRKELNADNDDRRSIVELLLRQVETADVLVLNKMDQLDEPQVVRVRALLRSLNKTARIMQSRFSRVPLHALLNTRRNQSATAKAATPDEKDVVANLDDAKPTTAHTGLASVTFAARRPFHPTRLHALATDPDFASKYGVVRSKGFVWLAGLLQRFVYWSHSGMTPPAFYKGGIYVAGGTATAQPLKGTFLREKRGMGWFLGAPGAHSHAHGHSDDGQEVEEEGHNHGNIRKDDKDGHGNNSSHDEHAHQQKGTGSQEYGAGGNVEGQGVLPEWFARKQQEVSVKEWGLFGDRRQELVLIGIGLKEDSLLAALDACLLSDAELQLPAIALRQIPNPIAFEQPTASDSDSGSSSGDVDEEDGERLDTATRQRWLMQKAIDNVLAIPIERETADSSATKAVSSASSSLGPGGSLASAPGDTAALLISLAAGAAVGALAFAVGAAVLQWKKR